MDEALKQAAPTWVWAAELGVLGGLGGVAGPLSAVLIWMAIGAPFVSVDLRSVGVCGAVCGGLGLIYGVLGAHASSRVAGAGYVLLPWGFPLGSLAGALGAYATLQVMFTPRILREVLRDGTIMGAVTAGLTLGVVWPLWLILHRRGRPTWPLLLLALLGVPLLGAIVMIAPAFVAWAT